VKDDDISLLVKRQVTNANVEKSKKKNNTKKESYTEINNYRKEMSIGEEEFLQKSILAYGKDVSNRGSIG